MNHATNVQLFLLDYYVRSLAGARASAPEFRRIHLVILIICCMGLWY
jgi:hypothetical protein